ncbi:MAG: sulfotransferase [Planctomycetaceae bacterium]|nr:sulfotransferase [Planctomycetaceae bacterium]
MNLPPVFVVGAQRSGTTMARLMLNAHSRLAIPFETNFIPEFWSRIGAFGDLADDNNVLRLIAAIQREPLVSRDRLGQFSPSDVLRHMRTRTYSGVVDGLFRTYAMSEGKVRWGDKTPGAEVSMNVLDFLFPDGLFLHVIRDGRDVAMSRKSVWNRSMVKSAHDWAWKVSMGRKFGALLGDRYREIRYEDLVRSPVESLTAICHWMGEEFEPSMLEYHLDAGQRMPERSLSHHQNSIRPPDARKVFMWRHSMSLGDRAIFQKIAGRLLDDLGYEIEDDRPWKFRLSGRMREVIYALRGDTVFSSPVMRSMVLSQDASLQESHGAEPMTHRADLRPELAHTT